MSNLFDGLQHSMFATVTRTMGYNATWQPSNELLEAQEARVLYNGPTLKEKLFSAAYNPNRLTIEYQLGDWDGLKTAVDDGSLNEQITIESIGTFIVKSVVKMADGKTFEAVIQPPKTSGNITHVNTKR